MNAFGINTLEVDLDLNRWICQDCSDGYFFNETPLIEGDQPYCEECEIENCIKCEEDPSKCTECAEDLILNYRGDACIDPIENCYTEPKNYLHNGDVWICPQCKMGYFTLDDTCQKCTLDPYCTSCENNQKCKSCIEPKILNEKQNGCMD